MTARRAITLVECLVVIAVIAVLIALVLPSLSTSRRASRITSSLANLHQIELVLGTYAAQSHDLYPAVDESQSYAISDSTKISFPYWQVYFTWTAIVSPGLPVADGAMTYVSPFSQRSPPRSPWPTSYHLSTSVVGAPALWTDAGKPGKAMEVGQTHASVRYPSSKAVAWDTEIPSPKGQPQPALDPLFAIPMLMADGSGSLRVPATATPAFANPNDNPVRSNRLHNTPQGVEGRDFESR